MHHLVLLVLCVLIDLIGLANVLWGEWIDVGWAPVSAALLRWLFPEQIIFSVIQFAEEILPGTDILPTATIGACAAPPRWNCLSS